ncbi:exodeoxyribonuclease VII large subunit [bacterium]|nr:MAG: exodeoxyribonuclease VII large subunit [bacterium]
MSFYTNNFSSIPSVSEFTNHIKDLLESNFSMISVQGEVSQPTVSSNGHLYFTLKDDKAQLSCVMWRSARTRDNVQLVHGQQITAFGSVQLYAPHGRYQLVVDQIQQAGIGALQAAFERLKKKLEAEGLFDISRKRAVPKFPKAIGVITSETSAAWHDIMINIQKRWPNVVVKLYHASTQGANAAPELVKGLEFFTAQRNVDTIIIGRGGGSIEDLWPFNEEAVARAIAASPIPVISGIGHETDFTIADFVADIRANTPTQAAVIATPDRHELLMKVEDSTRFIHQSMKKKWQTKYQLVQQISGSYALNKLINRLNLQLQSIYQIRERMRFKLETRVQRNSELVQKAGYERSMLKILSRIQQRVQLVEKLEYRLHQKMNPLYEKQHRQLLELDFQLKTLNPLLPMEKGFTRIIQDDKMIKQAQDFVADKSFTIEWKDGKRVVD